LEIWIYYCITAKIRTYCAGYQLKLPNIKSRQENPNTPKIHSVVQKLNSNSKFAITSIKYLVLNRQNSLRNGQKRKRLLLKSLLHQRNLFRQKRRQKKVKKIKMLPLHHLKLQRQNKIMKLNKKGKHEQKL